MKLSNSISPLLVAMRLFGINPIPSPRWYWLKIQLVLIFAIEFSLSYKIWMFHATKDFQNFWLKLFVRILKQVGDTISGTIDFMFTFLDSKRYMIPLNDFEIIDEALKSLGARANNRNTYRLLILQLVYFGVMPVLLNAFFYYNYWMANGGNGDHSIAFMSVVLTIMLRNGSSMIDCSICIIFSIIRERFKLINGIIRRMDNRGAKANITTRIVSREVTDDVNFEKLKILRECYHELWDIANRIVEAHGPHIFMAASTTLMTVTVSLWETYLMTKSDMNTAVLLIAITKVSWTIFVLTCLIVVTGACESTVSEAKVTSIVLQELMMKGNHNSTTMDEIRDFLMQLELEIHDFPACQFFDVNGKMVHSLLGAVATYLVILIQMHDDK